MTTQSPDPRPALLADLGAANTVREIQEAADRIVEAAARAVELWRAARTTPHNAEVAPKSGAPQWDWTEAEYAAEGVLISSDDAARSRKPRIGDEPRHIDGICECDYDADERGYFECSTDPRCAALR